MDARAIARRGAPLMAAMNLAEPHHPHSERRTPNAERSVRDEAGQLAIRDSPDNNDEPPGIDPETRPAPSVKTLPPVYPANACGLSNRMLRPSAKRPAATANRANGNIEPVQRLRRISVTFSYGTAIKRHHTPQMKNGPETEAVQQKLFATVRRVRRLCADGQTKPCRSVRFQAEARQAGSERYPCCCPGSRWRAAPEQSRNCPGTTDRRRT